MLLLTVIAAGFAGWGGVQYGLHQSMPNSDLDSVLHRDLELTAEQDRKMRILEANFAADRGRLQLEMRAANRELAWAITKEHVYGPDARQAIDRFHAAMASLQDRTVQHVLAMRAVLIPAQTKRFDENIERSLGANTP